MDVEEKILLWQKYEDAFGVPLQGPPLSYGMVVFSSDELAKYATDALAAGKPINWDDHVTPLPEGAVS